ncbi:TetR/AcrR family transcriptional regulator [Kineococcus indalonis]|uniref:TetR/AcrR family transcriptional regulator n=1 Tax=Kineococcus indalonis TaxID=2696566 RepID=UPI0014131EF2|nr:TetR/AcrR family transcriptional regulator [Kineococcus indalonis]NAZ88113.1 TetR family transcriptional regulator [Kineococcus indalonis]
MTRPLPVLGRAPSPVRADASRNREALLCAARRLVEEAGVAGFSMDCLAARAGVGKGTVFRRFGSRSGLFTALLDEFERSFQEQVLSGPPPLGPGAGPLQRLEAFGRHRLRFLAERGDLLRAAEADLRAGASPASDFARMHLRVLLSAAGAGGDLDVLAFYLLACLEAPLSAHLAGVGGQGPGGLDAHRLGDGWADLVRRVAPPPPG